MSTIFNTASSWEDAGAQSPNNLSANCRTVICLKTTSSQGILGHSNVISLRFIILVSFLRRLFFRYSVNLCTCPSKSTNFDSNQSGCGGLVFLPKSPEMSDNPSHCTIHLDHHNSHQFCTFYSVLDEMIWKNDHSTISALFSLLLLYFTFTFSSSYSHTHIHSHRMPPPSLSLCLSHTQNKERTSRPQSLSGNEKSISFYHFSLSIIQFHDLDHTVGNLDGVQIADKANFLVYFLFFQLL